MAFGPEVGPPARHGAGAEGAIRSTTSARAATLLLLPLPQLACRDTREGKRRPWRRPQRVRRRAGGTTRERDGQSVGDTSLFGVSRPPIYDVTYPCFVAASTMVATVMPWTPDCAKSTYALFLIVPVSYPSAMASADHAALCFLFAGAGSADRPRSAAVAANGLVGRSPAVRRRGRRRSVRDAVVGLGGRLETSRWRFPLAAPAATPPTRVCPRSRIGSRRFARTRVASRVRPRPPSRVRSRDRV